VPPAPAPQYAEHAQAGQPYGAASYPRQPGTPRRRKTWDLVLTIILLVMAFFGMLVGVGYGALFSDPQFVDQVFQQSGLGGFTGDAGAAPAVLVISHIVLFLIALGGGLPLLLTKRVAFWVPLAAGVVAAIFFWGALMTIFLSDPGFVATYS
jgi:hypothetical protein